MILKKGSIEWNKPLISSLKGHTQKISLSPPLLHNFPQSYGMIAMRMIIRLGIPISLTGRYSIQGRESFEGLNLWVSYVNKSGGIFVKELDARLPIELIYFDDESSEANCIEITKRLISKEKVDILLGPYSSSLALAASRVAENYRKTLWNHGGSTDKIFRLGNNDKVNYVISSITPASKYMTGVIDLIRATNPSANKIAAFSAENSGFSQNVAKGAKVYGELNGFEVREYKYISGAGNFSSLLNEALNHEPDLILGMGRAEDDVQLARQITEIGRRVNHASEPHTIGIRGGGGGHRRAIALVVASIKLFKDELNENVQGYLSPSQWESGININPDLGPKPREFTANFKSAYGKEPDYVAAQGYNGGLIVQRCIETSGSIKDYILRRTAKNSEFNTFYGAFKVDRNGRQIGHKMLVIQWQNGRKVIVHPKSSAEGGYEATHSIRSL